MAQQSQAKSEVELMPNIPSSIDLFSASIYVGNTVTFPHVSCHRTTVTVSLFNQLPLKSSNSKDQMPTYRRTYQIPTGRVRAGCAFVFFNARSCAQNGFAPITLLGNPVKGYLTSLISEPVSTRRRCATRGETPIPLAIKVCRFS